MAKSKGLTRNQSHDDDACSRKRSKTCDNSGVSPWPGLHNDILFSVIMQLGVIDFVAFSGVCKSWRSFALSQRDKFMASRSPMSIWINERPYKKECYLKVFEGRKFKTLLPHSAGSTCLGLTCGYLILYGSKSRDFWLVNPITRHELYFGSYPIHLITDLIKAILVFSPSISQWLLVAFHKNKNIICVCRAGGESWEQANSEFPILDLIAFKGVIYTLNTGCRICELRLLPKIKSTLIQTKNIPNQDLDYLQQQEFVNAGENLYVLGRNPRNDLFRVQELDFGEMKWVLLKEKIIEEYAFFFSKLSYSAAIKPGSWVESQLLQYMRYVAGTEKRPKGKFNAERMWYIPRDRLDNNLIYQ